jgi:hypothetical protein
MKLERKTVLPAEATVSIIALMEAARTSETSVHFNVNYTALHPRRL